MNVLQIEGWEAIQDELEVGEGVPHTRIFTVKRTHPVETPICCAAPMRNKGMRGRTIVDAPSFNLRVRWKLTTRRWECQKCLKSQSEDLGPAIAPGRNFTTRAVEHIAHQAATRTFAELALDLGTSSSLIGKTAKDVWGAEPTYNFPSPRYLGIDEIELPDPGDPIDTGSRKRAVFVDLESGRVLDMLMTNSKKAVSAWLYGLPEGHLVRGISMDFDLNYREAAQQNLPQAKIVIDHFHIMAEINSAFDLVRTREAKKVADRRKREEREKRDDPEKRFEKRRRILSPNRKAIRDLVALMRKSQAPKGLGAILLEPHLARLPIVAMAYKAKQDFGAMWKTPMFWFDAMVAFRKWDNELPKEIRYAFKGIIGRIRDHADVVFPFFEMPITNGPTELSHKNTRRLVMNSFDKMHLSTVRLKVRAQARLKTTPTKFHCDSCGERVPNRADKVAPYLVHAMEIFLVYRDDEIWLCERCKAYAASKDPSTWPPEDVWHLSKPHHKPAVAFSPKNWPQEDFGPAEDIWEAIDEHLADEAAKLAAAA